jgi:hypothetical protein
LDNFQHLSRLFLILFFDRPFKQEEIGLQLDLLLELIDEFPKFVLYLRVVRTPYDGNYGPYCVFGVLFLFIELNDAIKGVGNILSFPIFSVNGQQLVHNLHLVVLDVVLVANKIQLFEFIDPLLDLAIADQILDIEILEFNLGIDVLAFFCIVCGWVIVLVLLFVLVV